jgi:hypothetical protein
MPDGKQLKTPEFAAADQALEVRDLSCGGSTSGGMRGFRQH